MISIINNTNNDIKFPYYTTIYKFYNKLIKYNIINITYTKLVNKYINKNKCNNKNCMQFLLLHLFLLIYLLTNLVYVILIILYFINLL